MIRVFIGYDPREEVAFNVLARSIRTRASVPVSIVPLALNQLGNLMWRERDPLQSTDFSFSRFLVPKLCNYQGWAVFMDCDMLMLDDIANLWSLRDDKYAVMCVQHDYKPKEGTKFLGEVQTQYEKKNWSSLMLMNCDACHALTPEYVNTASGLDLHRFNWLESDDLIGAIPGKWNHLVDYDPDLPAHSISNLHYTSGGPYFDDYRQCGYAENWMKEKESLLYVEQPSSSAGR